LGEKMIVDWEFEPQPLEYWESMMNYGVTMLLGFLKHIEEQLLIRFLDSQRNIHLG